MSANWKFGVEIEFNTYASDREVAAALQAAGLQVQGCSRLANPADGWGVKYDGSIGRGWELVSPVLPGTLAGLAEVERVCAALRTDDRIDPRASSKCGLHVHLSGWERFPLEVIRNIARRYVNFEDTLDLLQPASRRGDANVYCRSNLLRFGSDRTEAAANLWDKVAGVKTAGALTEIISPTRYHKLNLQSLPRHGTVEFRHHAGTTTAAKITGWIDFLMRFADVAAKQERLHRRKVACESAVSRVTKLCRDMPLSTRRYVADRIAALN